MLRPVLCVVAVSSLLFSVAGGALAATISYRPALIPPGGPPVPVPLAIEPLVPTTADTIFFTAPLDGATYENDCFAAVALRGWPVLNIDEGARLIDISFDGFSPGVCPDTWDPVVGAFGDFGKLSAGIWTFQNSHSGSLDFTVVPEPSSLILLASGVIALLAYGWRRSTQTVPTTANTAATIVEYGSQP